LSHWPDAIAYLFECIRTVCTHAEHLFVSVPIRKFFEPKYNRSILCNLGHL
jgi:hypothetical protein